MAYKIIVQDGNITYSSADSSTDLNMTVEGTITTETITSADDLLVTAAGDVYLESSKWPKTTPAVGQFLGVNSSGILEYQSFVYATTTNDNLTTTDLDTAYPNINPGQVVVGPNVVYECINSAGLPTSWRIAAGGVKKTGDTMTGSLILNANPTNPLGAVTKQYVDGIITPTSFPWSGITDTPTTIAGYGITDAYTKEEVNVLDYLNFPPFAGVLKENQVPISASFGMSQVAWRSASFSFIDNTGKTVMFFHSDTPISDNHVYMAYRFSDVDQFIYDTDPVRLAFLDPGEKVCRILNMGTYFAIILLSTDTIPEVRTRVVAVWTNGSSSWQDWVLAYDVTSLIPSSGTANNLFLTTIDGVDRLLQYRVSSDQLVTELRVYDSSLALLRTQTLYSYTVDVTRDDQTAAGRHNATVMPLIPYSPTGPDCWTSYPFTWNSFTETFNVLNHCYFTYQTVTNTVVAQYLTLNISWTIPASWIKTGTGSPTNLIPVKSSGYRYHQLLDSTWNTDTGGCSNTWNTGTGYCTTVVTDEYSGNLNLIAKNTFSNVDVGNYRRLPYDNGYIYKTFGSNYNSKVTLNATYDSPDGSPWSKKVSAYWLSIIGNNVRMQATSSWYGTKQVQTTMSTTLFSTVARPNDTIILDSSNAVLDPQLTDPASVQANYYGGSFGVVVTAGTPTYYHTTPGQPLYTITISGLNRVYSDTGLTMPVIPATIGSVTVTKWEQVVAWNGSVSSPVYWALISDPTYLVYMAKYSAGSWTIPGSALLRTQQIYGNTQRGDSANTTYINGKNGSFKYDYSGQTLLTENGRILFNFAIPVPGNTLTYWGCYYTTTNTEATGNYTSFNQQAVTPPSYTLVGGNSNAGFGYNTNLGYYRATSGVNPVDLCFISSKDMAGSGPDLTEDQWFNNTATRYELFITTESATGLVAYTSAYPIFLGGYYSSLPAQAVTLYPNSNNYIYATRDSLDRETITISVSPIQISASNSRVLLANVVTDDQNVVSQQTFNVAQHDAVEELSNVNIQTKQAGDVLTWDGDYWVASEGAVQKTGSTMTGTLTMSGGATVTGLPAPVNSSDAAPKSYVDTNGSVPVGTVTYYYGTTPPTGWMIANGATFSAATYPALASVLGGTTLPDLRGVFIRGLDLGAGIDPGRTLNTLQQDSFESHNHLVAQANNPNFGTTSYSGMNSFQTAGTSNLAEYTTSTGGTETRPVNVSMLPIIKY